MTGGSLLVGAALALVTAAFVARPFRAARREDLGRSIERWVAEAAADMAPATGPEQFCRQCGRPLSPDSRFCSGCGTPVEGSRS